MAATRSAVALVIWLNLCLMIYLIQPQQTDFEVPVTNYYEFPPEEEHLMDFRNFTYIIEQPPCQEKTQGLIIVHTAPRNFEKRSVIRETWGDVNSTKDSPLRLIFALGSVQNDSLQSSLIMEQSQYGDLLQGNFMDAYFNVTYKHVMVLKWFNSECENAKFLLKIDDDVFLNTRKLLVSLEERKPINNSLVNLLQQRYSLLLCRKNANDPVIRSHRSKWHVSFKEYRESHYPEFCPGFAIIYSPDVARTLYSEVQKSNYFRLDDVYITGIMSNRANITITDLNPYVLYPDLMEPILQGEIPVHEVDFLVSWHNIQPNQMRSLRTLLATGR
ncbi:hypothetical protein KR009_001116 [Drosophila setifemur]|nr:hypothetical protein KR009_001116 [Drosophila setifemur]